MNLVEIMFTNKIDDFLLHNKQYDREVFLWYQLKYAKLLESILITWHSIKLLPQADFEKKAGIFVEVFKQAREEDDNPVLLFKKLPLTKKIEIYNLFV